MRVVYLAVCSSTGSTVEVGSNTSRFKELFAHADSVLQGLPQARLHTDQADSAQGKHLRARDLQHLPDSPGVPARCSPHDCPWCLMLL